MEYRGLYHDFSQRGEADYRHFGRCRRRYRAALAWQRDARYPSLPASLRDRIVHIIATRGGYDA